jgi:hypothetical protein
MSLSRLFGIPFEIYWPKNRYCQAEFGRVIKSDISAYDEGKSFFKGKKGLSIIAEENFLSLDEESHIQPFLILRKKKFLEKISHSIAHSTSIVVFCPRPFPQIYSTVVKSIRDLEFSDEVICSSKNEAQVLNQAKIRWGLHLRGTDARSSEFYYLFWFYFVYFLPNKTLLVSDDIHVIEMFKSNKSIVTRNQRLPVLYDKSKSWNDVVRDENSQLLPYNIERSEDCILDALEDLLLLSRLKILPTSKSTFLELAVNISPKPSIYSSSINNITAIVRVYKTYLRSKFL